MLEDPIGTIDNGDIETVDVTIYLKNKLFVISRASGGFLVSKTGSSVASGSWYTHEVLAKDERSWVDLCGGGDKPYATYDTVKDAIEGSKRYLTFIENKDWILAAEHSAYQRRNKPLLDEIMQKVDEQREQLKAEMISKYEDTDSYISPDDDEGVTDGVCGV